MGLGGLLWYLASPKQARNAHQNYAAVLGRSPHDPESGRLARRAFQNYGKMLADFLLIGALSPKQLLDRVEMEGLGHLDAALAGGRGCLIAMPHLGAWDMGGAAGGALGYRLVAVAEPFPGSLNDAIVETREKFGVKVIMTGRSAVRQILDALRQNSVVCLVCDLPSGQGIPVEFFGQRAMVAAGPASFAIKTGAPILPACIYRAGRDRYKVRIEAEVSFDARTNVATLTQSVVNRLEALIRTAPDQWYAFKPMFTPLPGH
jgi:KDO2-lipid IV(A) lauroyltransferase